MTGLELSREERESLLRDIQRLRDKNLFSEGDLKVIHYLKKKNLEEDIKELKEEGGIEPHETKIDKRDERESEKEIDCDEGCLKPILMIWQNEPPRGLPRGIENFNMEVAPQAAGN